MGILFSEIYDKSIALFNDPKITIAYETDKIQYEKIMYSFLQNAIGMFHNPSSVAVRLSDYTPPKGTMEIFEGDGKNQSFELSEDFEIIEKSRYNFIEGDKKITGKIEKIKKEIQDENTGELIEKEVYTVSFPDILPEGQQYALEQYFCGCFNSDFKGLNRNATNQVKMIENIVKEIIARLLIQAWAESQRNDYLDVNNNLTDTDFKQNPAYNMLRENSNFVQRINLELNERQNRLGWIIRFGQSNSYIGRG